MAPFKRFRSRQVADPEAQQNFDQIEGLFPLALENVAAGILLELAVAGTRRKVAFGASTLTWPGGGPFTNTLTLPHGLGAVPLAVLATAQLPAGGSPCVVHAQNFTATNVDFRGHATDGTAVVAATTRTFYWLAVA